MLLLMRACAARLRDCASLRAAVRARELRLLRILLYMHCTYGHSYYYYYDYYAGV